MPMLAESLPSLSSNRNERHLVMMQGTCDCDEVEPEFNFFVIDRDKHLATVSLSSFINNVADELGYTTFEYEFVPKKEIRSLIKWTGLKRNDPCYCGSDRKYKKCCLGQENLYADST
jgi:uncharacterized protein YchJ